MSILSQQFISGISYFRLKQKIDWSLIDKMCVENKHRHY